MFSKVIIEFSDKQGLLDSYSLSFELRKHSVAKKWANLLAIALKKYKIDDPGRFYGFGDRNTQIENVLHRLNETIEIINSHSTIIKKNLIDIYDQDTLNYLHHIFEIYHGLLDKQNSDFWKDSPYSARSALATLNILVHEIEGLSRYLSAPEAQITWYNLPKVCKLSDEEYDLFEDKSKKGTIYLLYTEIGKTLEDLSIDNDSYIHEDAFKPFRTISADFRLKFYDDEQSVVDSRKNKIKEFYKSRKDFFLSKNLVWGHPYLRSGSIPVADLINLPSDLIENIECRCWIKSIQII
jgi:hypothetical protein